MNLSRAFLSLGYPTNHASLTVCVPCAVVSHSPGGSSYFNMLTTYYNSSLAHVQNAVAYANSTFVGYTHGTNLTDADVWLVVSDTLAAGALPTDPIGVYFVMTAADVTASSGFCSYYCAWHSSGDSADGVRVQYAFVGNPVNQCPDNCMEQPDVSPNGNAVADALASIVVHELCESTTDPDLDAWYDPTTGNECADMCAWTFGSPYVVTTAAGASLANVLLGGRHYLIQQNWVVVGGGYCAMEYNASEASASPSPAPSPPINDAFAR